MDEITKENADIINSIQKAESLANESITIIFQQDVFVLKKKALNKEHLKKLTDAYISNTYNEYESTNNLYKVANEQFFFLNDINEKELNEDDRLSFIEMIFLSGVNGEITMDNSDEDEDTEESRYKMTIESIRQLTNIENIVFETKILELKLKKIKELFKEKETTKAIKKNTITESTQYLRKLFIKEENFNKIIELLTTEGIVSTKDENTFNWHGNPKEASLSRLKLLGALAYDLKRKKYYHDNISKKQIALAFSNSFPNFQLSNIYYGRIEKELSDTYYDTKSNDYLETFHFIKSL
jgi:hypothetical protein